MVKIVWWLIVCCLFLFWVGLFGWDCLVGLFVLVGFLVGGRNFSVLVGINGWLCFLLGLLFCCLILNAGKARHSHVKS